MSVLRRMWTIGMAGLILAAGIVSTGGRAEAATMPSGAAARPQTIVVGNFTADYRKIWKFKSGPLKRCVTVTAAGDFRYTEVKNNGGRGETIDYWTSQQLNAPSLSISITALKSNSSCGAAAKATGADLQQDWTGYACSFNPSLSVAIPWGVSFSDWPSCVPRNQAGYESTPSGSYSSYHQYNSGSPASYGDYSLPFDSSGNPCYSIYPTVTFYVGNSSDSYGVGNTYAQEVCLPWHGARA